VTKGFPEVQDRGLQGVKTGSSSQWQTSESIFEHEDIIQKRESLINESVGIALVGENGGVMGVRLGINKLQVETQSR